MLRLPLMVSWENVPAEGLSLAGEMIQEFGKVRRCRVHEDHGVGWLFLSCRGARGGLRGSCRQLGDS